MESLEKFGVKAFRNEPMSKHTTLGIGGPADWYIEVPAVPQLTELLKIADEKKIPVFFLGYGSNLLVSDAGIRGWVIRLRGEFENLGFNGSIVRAGAGVLLPTLVKQCAEKGLTGAEPLIGVPGSVGGALIMNAGTRDLEIGKITKSVEVISRQGILKVLTSNQIQFAYRSSSLSDKIITFSSLELKPGNKAEIQKKIEEFLAHRRKTQPIGTLNVGSVFKNPDKHFAAQLIENAGLKGLRKGNAQISPKHANFIVNCGGATAQDVKNLIAEIQKTVREKTGMELIPEVRMAGE